MSSGAETGRAKTARIPIKIVAQERLKKPDWIRVKAGSGSTRFDEIKQRLRENKLHTVCEEASCPNIGECFGKGTATFMILGDLCTRRCPFCDVAHGRPEPPDANEPRHLAQTIGALALDYVVITSVDPDCASARAGLRENDVISGLDRKPIHNAEEAVKLSFDIKGPKVLVQLWRDGRSRFLVVDETK